MSIVISPLVRLVITDSDTTNFDYDINRATELSILREISIEKKMFSISGRAETVSSTSNRVPSFINTGYSGVKFSFKTYAKPIKDGSNVASSEELLWESLSATDTIKDNTTSKITFLSGNTNKLRELYFYFIYEDGTYYKIKQGVVVSAQIEIDINQITSITWEIVALDMEYVSTPNLTGTPKDYRDLIFLRNKLSTITLDIGAKSYNAAIISGNLSIQNDVKLINRLRVGEIFTPTGHYVGDRLCKLQLNFFLNTQTDGTSTLMSDLLAYSTLSDINTTANVVLSLGGASNNKRIDVHLPTSKIVLDDPTIGLFNNVSITLYPQESSLGAGDEINIDYISIPNVVSAGAIEEDINHTYYWFGQNYLDNEGPYRYYAAIQPEPEPGLVEEFGDHTYYWFGQSYLPSQNMRRIYSGLDASIPPPDEDQEDFGHTYYWNGQQYLINIGD